MSLLRPLLPTHRPALFLAPMQDITDLPFMQTISECGGPDLYVTEYFRVHIHSRLDPYILRSITENPTKCPIIAQLIGNDPAEIIRSINDLKSYPIAGIDLNLGCPAPVVYRKNAGGGLLRHPAKLLPLLSKLRDACPTLPFTVKTRIGFQSHHEFDSLLDIFAQLPLDLLTIHARTVHERYQTPVHPHTIQQAVQALPYPVIANGNIVNLQSALAFHSQTHAAGLMIGRGAIRNPWIFTQIANHFEQLPPLIITGRMILDYIQKLYHQTAQHIPGFIEKKHVQKMKKYLVYITQGHPEAFEHQIRRAQTPSEFFQICHDFLDHDLPAPDLPDDSSRLFCGFQQFTYPHFS